jgi:hypothetical protein
MDDAIDELRDLGLSVTMAEDVLEWHEERLLEEREALGGQVVVRLMGFILGKPGSSRVRDTRLRALGIAFAAGLNEIAGSGSLTQAAEKEGCSPKALSLVSAEAGEALALPLGPNRRRGGPR